MDTQKVFPASLLPLLLLTTFLIYLPGLKGGFLFDDGPNIVNNGAVHISSLSAASLLQAAQSGTSGDLKRPISMLSFGINYALSGLNPFAFKLTNLAIHLAVGASLYLLTSLLLRTISETRKVEISARRWLPLLVSGAWLLHPLNLSPALYVVQRMTSLTTLFMVWGLNLYVWGRLRIMHSASGGMPLVWTGLIACGALAALSKENGVLLPLYMFVTELFLFGFRAPTARARLLLIGLFILTLALPTLIFLGLLAHDPDRFLIGYRIRDFTPYQRLLSEPRALWFYLIMLVTPNTRQLGLFHDDFPVSQGLLSPPTTLLCCTALMVLMAAAWLLRKRAPVFAFGTFFFFAGHALESTIFPLELVHEHRNYLPSYGILLMGFYYLVRGLDIKRRSRIRWALAAFAITLFAATTALRAEQWSNPIDYGQYEVIHHPLSQRANYEMGRIYEDAYGMDPKHNQELDVAARQYFIRSAELGMTSTEGLFGAIISGEIAGNVDTERWLKQAKERLANRPMSPMNAVSLANYLKCQYTRRCRTKAASTRTLLDAALSNPSAHIDKLSEAFIESTASVYFAVAISDPESAINYARSAASTLPNETQYKINLANVLIAVGSFDDANVVLESARKQDITGAYALRIATQKEFLEKSRHSANNKSEQPQ